MGRRRRRVSHLKSHQRVKVLLQFGQLRGWLGRRDLVAAVLCDVEDVVDVSVVMEECPEMLLGLHRVSEDV